MISNLNNYRMINDEEPKREELNIIMHEVAVEATKKAEIAKIELNKRAYKEMQEALVREGLKSKSNRLFYPVFFCRNRQPGD